MHRNICKGLIEIRAFFIQAVAFITFSGSKVLFQFTFEKIPWGAKREKKNNLLRGKIPNPSSPPPPTYKMVCPLHVISCNRFFNSFNNHWPVGRQTHKTDEMIIKYINRSVLVMMTR